MRISTIDPSSDTKAVEDVIKIYQEAFGNEPWNEGWKCSKCEHVMPLTPQPSHCTKCDSNAVAQYWPHDTVLADFRKEMMRPNAVCLVATVMRKIVGFAWGYSLGIHDKSLAEVEMHLDAPGLFPKEDPYRNLHCDSYFYLDEVAVHPDHQQDGTGKALVREIWGNHCDMLLRTLRDSHMFFLAQRFGGEVVRSISRDRVIMLIRKKHETNVVSVSYGSSARRDDSPMSDPGFRRGRGDGM